MDPIWTQSYEELVATKKRIMESKPMRQWRHYGRPLWALAVGAADIGISENKTAAMMGVGAGFLGTLAVRSRTGLMAYAIPTIAYGIGRTIGHFLSGRPDPHKSPVTQQLAANIPVASIPSKDDAYNTIPGLSEQGMAAASRPVYGFGSGWRGLFSMLRHPVLGFRSWRFQRQLARGAKAYETMVRSALEGTEYAKAAIKTGVEMEGPLQQAGAIHLIAKMKGKPAVSMYREFSPSKIYLGRIEIAPEIRGQGIGSVLRKGEANVFKKTGFSPKTLVEADVVNERTAYLHLKTYGGEAVPYASQITLEEELYKVGNLPEVYAKNPERFKAAILRKEYNESKYIGARATGTLGYLERRAEDSRKIGAMIDETLADMSAQELKRNRKLKQNLLHSEAIKAPTVLNAERRQSHGIVRPPRKRLM